MEILLHPRTQLEVDRFIDNPSQSLGVFGPSGAGKAYVAQYIALRCLKSDHMSNNPNLYIVRPTDNRAIGIEEARGVQAFFKLISTNKNDVRRVAIIEDAHLMTTEAQNALLKILEEPPAGSLLILTATHENALLSTIRSRLTVMSLQTPSQADVSDFFEPTYTKADISRAWLMSGQRIGLASALMANSEHEMLEYIETAKNIIGMDTYQRMVQIDNLQKQDLPMLLEALDIISTAAFKQTIDSPVAQRWHKIRKQVQAAREDIQYNLNSRLLITDLLLTV